MFRKYKNRPTWYKLWIAGVAFCAIYFLIKFFFFEVNSFDRGLEVFALFAILIDYFAFPENKSKSS